MKFRGYLVAAAAIGAIALASPASASLLTAQQILSQFNAVISNDFTSQHDVEGRLVANRIVGGATFYNQPRDAASSFAAVNALSVTSGLTNGNVNNGGNVDVLGTNAGHFNLNGGHYVTTPNFAMSDFTIPLDALSAQIRGMTANSTVLSIDPNNFTFNEGTSSSAVFRLTAASLQTARNIIFTGSATTIFIDVTGTSFSDTANFNVTAGLNQTIIWNFEDATTLSFQGWHGSVLAPKASVTNSSAMEGTLYALNFTGNGELHDYNFTGRLPNDPSSVPEPMSLALLATGIAGLVIGRQVRNKPASKLA